MRVRRAVTASVLALLAAGSGAVAAPDVAHAATVRGLQWWLDSLHVERAQQVSKGEGVVVGVIDTGVYPDHPDLQGQVLAGAGFGINAASDGRSDDDGHGTSMASVIAGKGGGVMHELGIAPEAKILPISNGKPFTANNIADSIRWAADHGAKVISISEGGFDPAPDAEVQAVNYALSKDVVVVASAGNDRKATDPVDISSPANIPGVIAVSATTKSNTLWSGSAHGDGIVLASPGTDIIGAVPPAQSPDGYGNGDGTSGAGAIVSGVAALVRAKYPKLNAANVINRLIRTAKDLGPSGRDETFGFGLVDPVAALTASVSEVKQNPLLASPGSAARPTSDATQSDDNKDSGSPVAISVTNKWGAIAQVTLCLGVAVGVAILVFYSIRRSRRQTAAARVRQPPPGWGQPYGPAGASPPGHPGWAAQPPPGHPGWARQPPAPGSPVQAGLPGQAPATPPGQPPHTGYPPPSGQLPPPGPPSPRG